MSKIDIYFNVAKVCVIPKRLSSIRFFNLAKTLFFAELHFCYICRRNAKTKLR